MVAEDRRQIRTIAKPLPNNTIRANSGNRATQENSNAKITPTPIASIAGREGRSGRGDSAGSSDAGCCGRTGELGGNAWVSPPGTRPAGMAGGGGRSEFERTGDWYCVTGRGVDREDGLTNFAITGVSAACSARAISAADCQRSCGDFRKTFSMTWRKGGATLLRSGWDVRCLMMIS